MWLVPNSLRYNVRPCLKIQVFYNPLSTTCPFAVSLLLHSSPPQSSLWSGLCRVSGRWALLACIAWLPSAMWYFRDFSMPSAAIVSFGCLAKQYLLHGHTTKCLPVVETWTVFHFWLLWMKLPWRFVFVPFCVFISRGLWPKQGGRVVSRSSNSVSVLLFWAFTHTWDLATRRGYIAVSHTF